MGSAGKKRRVTFDLPPETESETESDISENKSRIKSAKKKPKRIVYDPYTPPSKPLPTRTRTGRSILKNTGYVPQVQEDSGLLPLSVINSIINSVSGVTDYSESESEQSISEIICPKSEGTSEIENAKLLEACISSEDEEEEDFWKSVRPLKEEEVSNIVGKSLTKDNNNFIDSVALNNKKNKEKDIDINSNFISHNLNNLEESNSLEEEKSDSSHSERKKDIPDNYIDLEEPFVGLNSQEDSASSNQDTESSCHSSSQERISPEAHTFTYSTEENLSDNNFVRLESFDTLVNLSEFDDSVPDKLVSSSESRISSVDSNKDDSSDILFTNTACDKNDNSTSLDAFSHFKENFEQVDGPNLVLENQISTDCGTGRVAPEDFFNTPYTCANSNEEEVPVSLYSTEELELEKKTEEHSTKNCEEQQTQSFHLSVNHCLDDSVSGTNNQNSVNAVDFLFNVRDTTETLESSLEEVPSPLTPTSTVEQSFSSNSTLTFVENQSCVDKEPGVESIKKDLIDLPTSETNITDISENLSLPNNSTDLRESLQKFDDRESTISESCNLLAESVNPSSVIDFREQTVPSNILTTDLKNNSFEVEFNTNDRALPDYSSNLSEFRENLDDKSTKFAEELREKEVSVVSTLPDTVEKRHTNFRLLEETKLQNVLQPPEIDAFTCITNTKQIDSKDKILESVPEKSKLNSHPKKEVINDFAQSNNPQNLARKQQEDCVKEQQKPRQQLPYFKRSARRGPTKPFRMANTSENLDPIKFNCAGEPETLTPNKREAIKEKDVLIWIYNMIDEPARVDYEFFLKDGCILCRLMNRIKPDSIPEDDITWEGAKSKQKNIQNFLNAAEAYGVPKAKLFFPEDLLHLRHIPRVTRCIYALAKIAEEDPALGPACWQLGDEPNFTTSTKKIDMPGHRDTKDVLTQLTKEKADDKKTLTKHSLYQ